MTGNEKERIQQEIVQNHTNKGRRVLKSEFKHDRTGALEAIHLRCVGHYVSFSRDLGGDFVSRALAWLRKGVK